MPEVLTLDQRATLAQTITRTLRASTRALPQLAAQVLNINGPRFSIQQSVYTNNLELKVIDNERGVYAYTFKSIIKDDVENEVIQLKGKSSSLEMSNISFPWSDGRQGTALETVEKMLHLVKEAAQRPISAGCVQAFFQTDGLFWVSKRPTSDKIILYNDKYYIWEGNNAFIRVYKADGTFDVLPNEIVSGQLYSNPATITVVSDGRYFYLDALTTVYVNQIPFDTVARYIDPQEAERFYETVVVDGQQRFVDVEKPGVGFFRQALHSYSQRIEEFVPKEKLFLKGENDLYAKRPVEETPFLGWELEACDNLSSVGSAETATKFKEQLPFLIFCKPDGSINPRGFETVSVPATLDAWKESGLADALDVMRTKPYSMRSFEHSSCGFHVHVSRSALSVLDLQKMERFMHNPDNRSFLSDVAGRGPNTYQNYDDNLFNNRKSHSPESIFSTPSTINENSENGIVWFSRSDMRSRLSRWSAESTTPFKDRLLKMCQFLNNYMSYSSFDIALRTHHPDEHQAYKDFSAGRYTEFSAMCGAAYYGHLPEGWEPYVINIFSAMGVGRPNLAAVVKHFLPEVPLPSEEGAEESITPAAPSTIPAWKSKVSLKSKAPYKRVDSYKAARDTAGPVGKGYQRYDVLNTKNRNTVEFRLFKGTMNPTSVFRYLEFVDSLVRFVGTTSATDDGVHFSTYLKFLVTDSFNVVRYENLITFLLDKKYIERKLIRRRDLIKQAAGDGDCNLAVKAKSFSIGGKSEPLYDITTRSAAERSFTVPVPSFGRRIEVNWDTEIEADPDFGGPNCTCPDCADF